MNAANLLIELRGQGIEISAENNMLRCRARLGILTPALRNHLTKHKKEIIEILQIEALLAIKSEPWSVGEDDTHRCRIIRRSESMIWYEDAVGRNWRFFPSLNQIFPVDVVKPGDPATCTNCGKSYQWLPFPALANLCRNCQPPSSDWIPEPGEPRFENGVEFRRGPACYACGETERWRKNKLGPWICKICHPPA
jgi:hypothetical protein